MRMDQNSLANTSYQFTETFWVSILTRFENRGWLCCPISFLLGRQNIEYASRANFKLAKPDLEYNNINNNSSSSSSSSSSSRELIERFRNLKALYNLKKKQTMHKYP